MRLTILDFISVFPEFRKHDPERMTRRGIGRAEDRAGHSDSSTGSELKAAEEACREASRTAEPLNGLNY